MRYEMPDALVEAHVQDFIDSSDGESQSCANLALSVLLAVLMTAQGGDKEKVLEDLATLFRYAMHGMDTGELRFAPYS